MEAAVKAFTLAIEQNFGLFVRWDGTNVTDAGNRQVEVAREKRSWLTQFRITSYLYYAVVSARGLDGLMDSKEAYECQTSPKVVFKLLTAPSLSLAFSCVFDLLASCSVKFWIPSIFKTRLHLCVTGGASWEQTSL